MLALKKLEMILKFISINNPQQKLQFIWSFKSVLLYLGMDNYLDQALDEIFTVITEHRNPWPSHFTKTQKLDFIDTLIDHYTAKEVYENCSDLNEIRQKIENAK